MKKKLLVATMALIGLGLIIFAILVALGVFRQKEAGLLVETEPTSEVYIDGAMVGSTPYEVNRQAGEVLIQLVPNVLEGQELDDYETKVNLEPGVKTIIKRTFNLDKDLSSGITVSFEKIGGDESLITVVSVPNHAQIFIGGKAIGFAPIRTKVSAGDHQLLISSLGHLDKSLPIRIYKGYKLTAVVKLPKDTNPEPTLPPVLSENTQNLGSIEISDTGVGFLRVREESVINSVVVGQVSPGEVYDVLQISEDNAWYKIKVVLDTHEGESSEIEGWVSGEYSLLNPSD
ncbi:PEGA domain-containing protein [Candidatus Microgenomates bacterium]|nr:PEGA domain-containing protein [Candidatus Microgenomates bacterium]